MELKAERISKSYGLTPVLEEVSLSLQDGARVGLVGQNGTGKSTLLRILAGQITPDAGTVSRSKGCRVGYMPQDTAIDATETVTDYLREVSGFADLESRLDHTTGLEEYERRDGYAFYSRLETILDGFGLENSKDLPLSSFSTGQKSKIFMTGVLLSDPDFLLLDEPTNNLDLSAIIWLERFLTDTRTAYMIVSHDRVFLDKLVNRIIELDSITHGLVVQNGNYSEYLERKEKAFLRQTREYDQLQDEKTRLREAAQAKRQQAQSGSVYRGTDNDKFQRGFKRDRASTSARAARAIEKRISHLPEVERPISKTPLRIDIAAAAGEGSTFIATAHVTAGYPGGIAIHVPDLYLSLGKRIAIVGLNGAGKSTVLKTLSGELPPVEGEVSIGRNLVLGTFTQEHELLPKECTVYEFLKENSTLAQEQVHALGIRYGFSEDRMRTVIGKLSPGARARLLFALFAARGVNALILDEPTNHLDIEAMAALQEMLSSYEGTVIVVSHDRYFLHGLKPDAFFFVESGAMRETPDLEEYVEAAAKRAIRISRRL